MSEEPGFIDAIVSQPFDDLPRLVYADWLDDHDRPAQAEFIRLQIQMANEPAARNDPALQQREQELLQFHGATWLGTLPPGISPGGMRWERGFPVQASMTAKEFLQVENNPLDALRQRFPIIGLHLREAEGQMNSICNSPRMAGIERLDFRMSTIGDEGMAALATSPYAGNLRRLNVFRNGITAAGMATLAGAPLTQLRRLDVSENPIGNGGLFNLSNSGTLPRLRELKASGCGLGHFGEGAATGSGFANLHSIDLSHNRLIYSDTAIIPGMRNLHTVDLSHNKELPALYNGGRPSHISRLRLSHCAIEGRNASFPSYQYPRLRELDLENNLLGDDGMQALTGYCGGHERLQSLNVANNNIGVNGAEAFGRGHWPSLRNLSFAGNPIRALGIRSIAGSARPASGAPLPAPHDYTRWEERRTALGSLPLEVLNLSETEANDRAVAALAFGTLTALHTLDLSGNNISNDGARMMLSATNLPALRELRLQGNPGINAYVNSSAQLGRVVLDKDLPEPLRQQFSQGMGTRVAFA